MMKGIIENILKIKCIFLNLNNLYLKVLTDKANFLSISIFSLILAFLRRIFYLSAIEFIFIYFIKWWLYMLRSANHVLRKTGFFFYLTCVFYCLFLFLFSLVLLLRWYFSFFGYAFSLRSLKRTKASPAVGDAVDTRSVSPPADRASPLPLPLSYRVFRQIHQPISARYFATSPLHLYAIHQLPT